MNNLAIYLAIQASLVLVGKHFPQYFSVEFQGIIILSIGYKINLIKVISPVVFFGLFKLPIVMGLGTGIVANHISSN